MGDWIKEIEMGGACGIMVEKREICKLLAIRLEPKRLIEKLISVRIILKRIFRHWMGEIELD